MQRSRDLDQNRSATMLLPGKLIEPKSLEAAPSRPAMMLILAMAPSSNLAAGIGVHELHCADHLARNQQGHRHGGIRAIFP